MPVTVYFYLTHQLEQHVENVLKQKNPPQMNALIIVGSI